MAGRIRASSFVRNVMVVMSGTAAAQILGFALTPVISRLFSPADFGVFGSFGSVSTIIAAGVTLQYTQAIMLPREKHDAMGLFVISCISTLALGLLLLAFCLIAPAWLHGLMQTRGAWVLVLLLMATVVNGLNESCQAWCVRSKAFKHTSASQVIRSLSANGSQAGFGCLHMGSPGLIIGSVLGDALASLNLLRVVLPDLRAFLPHVRWARLRQLATEYRDFPMYSASQNVINALSLGLPVLLLTHFYGIATAGAYAFGGRILKVPMRLVTQALRQVLFQKACETSHHGGKLLPLYMKMTIGLLALSIPGLAVFLLWGPRVFTWVFGSQWQTAGEFARWIVVWMAFSFCNLPAVLFVRIIRIQRTFFLYDIILLAARLVVLVLGGLHLTALNAVMLFSIVGAVMNIFLILLVGHAVIKRESQPTLCTEGA